MGRFGRPATGRFLGRRAGDILAGAGLSTLATAAFERGFGRDDPRGGTGSFQLAGPSSAPALRPADLVVGQQGPVQFVKMWQAGAAIFAIDSEGKRWAWRPKLGIWKRTRVFTNIVISRKDVFRARRLVRVSKRLNAIRKSI